MSIAVSNFSGFPHEILQILPAKIFIQLMVFKLWRETRKFRAISGDRSILTNRSVTISIEGGTVRTISHKINTSKRDSRYWTMKSELEVWETENVMTHQNAHQKRRSWLFGFLSWRVIWSVPWLVGFFSLNLTFFVLIDESPDGHNRGYESSGLNCLTDHHFYRSIDHTCIG